MIDLHPVKTISYAARSQTGSATPSKIYLELRYKDETEQVQTDGSALAAILVRKAEEYVQEFAQFLKEGNTLEPASSKRCMCRESGLIYHVENHQFVERPCYMELDMDFGSWSDEYLPADVKMELNELFLSKIDDLIGTINSHLETADVV